MGNQFVPRCTVAHSGHRVTRVSKFMGGEGQQRLHCIQTEGLHEAGCTQQIAVENAHVHRESLF